MNSDPHCRPSFQELLERLKDLLRHYTFQNHQLHRPSPATASSRENAQDWLLFWFLEPKFFFSTSWFDCLIRISENQYECIGSCWFSFELFSVEKMMELRRSDFRPYWRLCLMGSIPVKRWGHYFVLYCEKVESFGGYNWKWMYLRTLFIELWGP